MPTPRHKLKSEPRYTVTDYKRFRSTAQTIFRDSEEKSIKFMDLLVETEPKRALWICNPQGIRGWTKLLKAEGWCTAALYRKFKKARELGLDVEKLGVYGATTLVVFDEGTRKRALKEVLAWIEDCQVPPTYQLIHWFIRAIRGVRPKRRRITPSLIIKRLEKKIQTLTTTIEKLQAENRQLKSEAHGSTANVARRGRRLSSALAAAS